MHPHTPHTSSFQEWLSRPGCQDKGATERSAPRGNIAPVAFVVEKAFRNLQAPLGKDPGLSGGFPQLEMWVMKAQPPWPGGGDGAPGAGLGALVVVPAV